MRGFITLSPLVISTCFLSFQTFGADRKARDLLERQEINGEVVYFGDKIQLEADEKLIFDEPARVHLKELELDEFSEIDTQGNSIELLIEDNIVTEKGGVNISNFTQDVSGPPGESGDSGEKALDGLKGTAGAPGADGGHASSGAHAGQIYLVAPYIEGDLILIAQGGKGGRGGNGGDGGKGGAGLSGMDARVLYNFRGMTNLPIETLIGIGAQIGVPVVGQVLAILQLFNGLTIGDGFDGFDGGAGGNAGRGGNGGNGGNGGKIELTYGKRVGLGKTYVSTKAGAGGAGGRAGVPGTGGPGGAGGKAGDIWGRDGKPGNPGEVGLAALAGEPGKPGLPGSIRWVETGDPKWIQCWTRYREIIDLTQDLKFAREILRSCMQ